MKATDFVDLVTQMRAAQKKYYKRRTTENMQASIKLEKEVDQALAEGIEIPEGMPKQLDMFAVANTTKGD